MNGLGERNFYKQNRTLLAALVGIPLILATGVKLIDLARYPVLPTRFNINSSPNSHLRFWIITAESYDATLWIGQPEKLDRKAFDRITGCNDYSTRHSLDVIVPKWTIKSAWDQRVVVQNKAALINPAPNECSSTTGGHVFSLGKIAVDPGWYQFELKFGDDIPELMNFPIELNIHCCGKHTETLLGSLIFPFAFLSPVLLLIFAFLVILLLVRLGRYYSDSKSETR